MTDTTNTIPLVPSWIVAAQIYTAALEDGTPKGQQAGREGIADMGRKMDQLVSRITEMQDRVTAFQERFEALESFEGKNRDQSE